MKGQGMFNATSDNKALEALVQVVEEFRKFDNTMEANQILIFLLAVVKPGIRLKEIEKITGLSNSAVSRNILALSKESYAASGKKEKRPGHDLIVAMSDAFDSRAKVVAPTARGRKLAETLSKHVLSAT